MAGLVKLKRVAASEVRTARREVHQFRCAVAASITLSVHTEVLPAAFAGNVQAFICGTPVAVASWTIQSLSTKSVRVGACN